MDRTNRTEGKRIVQKRIAAIDIGTNTILLLIGEISENGRLLPLYQAQNVARLGKDVNKTGKLNPENMDRALQILREYKIIAEGNNVSKVLLVGTSALRDASNSSDFLKRVQENLGWKIRIIDGEEEARLSFLGALSNKTDLTGQVLVVDIGGGSTEFAWGHAQAYDARKSLNIGSVRLTEQFCHHDPPLLEEMDSCITQIRNSLNPLLMEVKKPDHLVGVAGTVTTLAAMSLQQTTYNSEKIDGFRLSLQEISKLIRKMQTMPARERLKLPGLYPGREDVILAGSILLLEIMRIFSQKEVIVSDRGLRFGVILDYLRSGVKK